MSSASITPDAFTDGVTVLNGALGKTLIVGGATSGDGWILGCGYGLDQIQLEIFGDPRPIGQ